MTTRATKRPRTSLSETARQRRALRPCGGSRLGSAGPLERLGSVLDGRRFRVERNGWRDDVIELWRSRARSEGRRSSIGLVRSRASGSMRASTPPTLVRDDQAPSAGDPRAASARRRRRDRRKREASADALRAPADLRLQSGNRDFHTPHGGCAAHLSIRASLSRSSTGFRSPQSNRQSVVGGRFGRV